MRTIQEQYNLIKENKGDKNFFMKSIRNSFPEYINQFTSFDDAITILKSKSLISEITIHNPNKYEVKDLETLNILLNFEEPIEWTEEERTWIYKYIFPEIDIDFLADNISTEINGPEIKEEYIDLFQTPEIRVELDKINKNLDKVKLIKVPNRISDILKMHINENWFAIFEAEIKSIEKETSKEVLDTQKHAFQPSDRKNIDNIYGQSFLNGYYAEMKDPENWEKSVDDLKDIVAKNMAKDINYYAKNAMFGEKGVGFVNNAPGLGATKEPKGKNKSSGYGDLDIKGDLDIDIKPAKKNVKDTLSGSEAKTNMPKKVKEMTVTPQSSKGVKKMDMPGKPKTIKLKEGQEEQDKVTQIASELEKMNGDEENMYFNRRSDLTPEAKDALEREGYTVKFQDVQDTSEDEMPWHVYKICKIEGDNSLKEIRSIIKQIIKEELTQNSININGKTVRTYTQNGDTSYNVIYDDGDKGIIYVNDEGWDDINTLHTNSLGEQYDPIDLRTPEEKKKQEKIFPKKQEDLKKTYQDQQKNPNKYIFKKN